MVQRGLGPAEVVAVDAAAAVAKEHSAVEHLSDGLDEAAAEESDA